MSQFILLPERGLRALPGRTFQALTSVGGARSTLAPLTLSIPELPGTLKVIDSILEDGPKLVEAPESAGLAMRSAPIGFRLAPIREYEIATVPLFAPNPVPAASSAASIQITVNSTTGAPVQGVIVTAFTDFKNNLGASGTTDVAGTVSLALGPSPVALERFYIAGARGFWGAYRASFQINDGDRFAVTPIDLTVNDSLRQVYGTSNVLDGVGVKVGVIDTGIDLNHPDLVVGGGRNTAQGEPASSYGNNGMGHGTHVAGIIASRGKPPQGVSGMAPGISLMSYRAFGANKTTTTNYEIVKALILAVVDGCDIVNLSLGGTPADDVMRDAIQDASDQGTLVVAAAGNGTRQGVDFPAAYSPAVAVSAYGRKGTFPPGAYEESYVDANPVSSVDPDNFLASFTNIGPEIFFTATGVGIVSTIAGGGYGSMSGTSMAAPVVAGIAAKLLAQNAAVLNMPRDTFRTRAFTNLLSRSAADVGFPFNCQGFGRPQ